MSKENWHNLSSEEVIKFLGTDIEEGMQESEFKKRQEKFGKNKLPEEKPLSKFRIFLEQFRSPLIYILVMAGIITLVLKKYGDAIVIFSAVFLNTIVGFIQENKASKTLKELKKVVKHAAEVLRGGNFKIIDSADLVPGDIVILNPGDKVPADGRIIESRNLKINEMVLTGEWLAAKKRPETLPIETPLADRDNMIYMGCVIEEGKGKAIVTSTGINTEIGKVAALVKETKEEKTPYQRKLAHFSKIIGIIIGIICFGIFLEGVITGGEFIEMFTTVVAIAVAAIPEGLPMAMTVILALGMQRILKRKGLVRRLASAETLGSTSIITTDKTGTLTEGRMKMDKALTVPEILDNAHCSHTGEDKNEKNLLFKIAVICVEAFIENPKALREQWIIRGRPTDRALLEAGAENGIFKEEIEKKEPIIYDLPFTPLHKYSASFHRISEKEAMFYILGAPEKILSLSALDDATREILQKKFEELAQQGLRIVAAGYKKTFNFRKYGQNNEEEIRKEIENVRDLIFSGFITLKDPIRKEVKEAIKTCQEAGMRVIIVTGDHKLTTKAVAKELGFKVKEDNILEGKDLDKLSDKDFEDILEKIQIYARVEPKHKMRIVQAWQEKGEVVAMTGDGINDAPALKKADIGVALGSGTEVAKETSDLVLLNDSFSIIVAAVQEGRAILDNIRKVITYLLSDSFTEIILVGVSIMLGFPLPITAVQILWVNLIEDGLPNIALAFEPKEKDIMRQKARGHKIPLLTREMKAIIFIIGLATDLILLGIFFWLSGQNYPLQYLRTIIFAMLGIDSISYVFCCKSLRRNIWQINLFDNKILLLSWFFGAAALLAAIYLPALNSLLDTVPLPLSIWKIIIGLGIINIILIELAKYYFIVRQKTES